MSKGEAVVEGNALTSMPDSALKSFKASFKEREKSKPKLSGARTLSTKGGTFSLGDEDLGTYLELCIIDWVYTNTFYPGRWSPNETRSPVCAAVGREENDHLSPVSVDGFNPVHDACGDCPKNEWGSDPTGGKGKHCKNSVRLVVAPVVDVREAQSCGQSAAHVAAFYLNVPVTSVYELMKVISITEGMLGEVCAAQTNATIEAMEGGHKVTFMPATTTFPSADKEYIDFLNDLMESNLPMLMSAPRMEGEEEAVSKPNKSSRRPGKAAGKKAAAKKGGVRRRRAS